ADNPSTTQPTAAPPHAIRPHAAPPDAAQPGTLPADVLPADVLPPAASPRTASPRTASPPDATLAADRREDDLLAVANHPANGWGEPCPNDEADRDAPHPSTSNLPDPLDIPYQQAFEPLDLNEEIDTDEQPFDAAAQRALDIRLAQIKHDAHTNPTSPRTKGITAAPTQLRPGKTEIYVHLTDHTLATGTGVLRAETIGPLLATQLTELVGHGPYAVRPVIDLNDAVSVNSYEIPTRIRERVKLIHPVELFPYGTRETNGSLDLDHLEPYDPLGPPDQTSTRNLIPLGRFAHRVKTHAHGWHVRRLDHKTLVWTTPHGFTFHVTPTGTHRTQPPPPS
ncbi:hypothetical protein PWY36_04380, partial [Kribbella solani]|nr:hypothetical protein [Kribbella solani]